MGVIKKIAKRIAPPHTRVGRNLKKNAAKIGLAKPLFFNEEYDKWIEDIEPHSYVPVVYDKYVSDSPLFSIVIPFFNTPDKYLIPLLDSIENQIYQNWELIIADASTNNYRSDVIRTASKRDVRFKYHKLTTNEGISGNTNQALKKIKGKYIVFSDHDDTLNLHALNEAATLINQDNSIDIIYTDEDKITDDGKIRHSPYFKPDWSPHLFLYTNYTNHLSVIRSTLVQAVHGLRSEFDGSQDYDLLLRVHTIDEKQLKVAHISKILYHWREAAGSTAVDYNRKSYAFEAGRKALAEYCLRRGYNSKVHSIENTPGFFKQLFKNDVENTKVHVRVFVSNKLENNNAFISKIERLTKSIYNVSFSQENNNQSDITIEINASVLPKYSDWLDSLVGVLVMQDVAVVAPRILTSDRKRIYDMGYVYSSLGEIIELNKGLGEKDLTINGGSLWVRDVDELSGRVLVYRTKQGKVKNKSQHYLIWSHTDFIFYPVFGVETFFNNNLQVLNDGRITVNG